jgi:lipoprotein-releasing system permease protein
MKKSVITIIANTHLFTNVKATLIAALGVALGVGVYLFMNSLNNGFSKFSRENMFTSNAHIKIYVKDKLSTELISTDKNSGYLINNAQIIDESKKLYDSETLLKKLQQEEYITSAIALVDFAATIRRGSAEIKGSGIGVNMIEYAKMFSTNKYMVAGSIEELGNHLSGAIIGSGIANKLSLRLGDDLNVTSGEGVNQVMKIVGIFTMGNSVMDNNKIFVNLSSGRTFLKASSDFVTHIYANTLDADKAGDYAKKISTLTDYTVENWQISSAELLSRDKTSGAMMGAISFTILVVAGFGIYNILSSTINQKINDIAILKATGFDSNDVTRIFMLEALILGIIGTVLGLALGSILIAIMSQVYMGEPVGYFPITFVPRIYVQSFMLGIIIILCAGYFPARRAANVDPVSIFRR